MLSVASRRQLDVDDLDGTTDAPINMTLIPSGSNFARIAFRNALVAFYDRSDDQLAIPYVFDDAQNERLTLAS